MINTIYPHVIEKVLIMCELYMKKECSAKKLQETMYWAEYCIDNFEEKDLRNFFMIVEGDIDSIRVMANGTDLDREEIFEIENREKILEVISRIKEKLING